MRSSRRCLPKERGLQSAGRRRCVRAAKEMDLKSIGLCRQGFESPRCRLQGWREAKENSWRLVACARGSGSRRNCVQVARVRAIWEKKNVVTRAIPTELLSNTKKLCSPGKTTPPVGLEPTIFGLEVRCLVH